MWNINASPLHLNAYDTSAVFKWNEIVNLNIYFLVQDSPSSQVQSRRTPAPTIVWCGRPVRPAAGDLIWIPLLQLCQSGSPMCPVGLRVTRTREPHQSPDSNLSNDISLDFISDISPEIYHSESPACYANVKLSSPHNVQNIFYFTPIRL